MGSIDEEDPVVASYDVFLTDSEISRYVFQYIDRPQDLPYNARKEQKPLELRMKPSTGLVEIDVPILTGVTYTQEKGLKYGEAMRKSRSAREGGSFGVAGGFSGGAMASSGAVRVKTEGPSDVEVFDKKRMVDASSLVTTQAIGGRIKPAEEGDPVHMLGTFKGKNLHLSPVTAVVQLQPQVHHLDAMDELPKGRGGKGKKEEEERTEPEARAIDVKVKGAEEGGAMLAGNLELLKRMQEEKWKKFDWIDAETEESWYTYENFMMNQNPEELPQLEANINSETYLDGMSAPRIDPAHPELTGWAMKQNREKQRDGVSESEDEDN
ncbi:hypothetical protein N7540_001001 [Penicillium herquei]|nr:hypothetical protein N7540_001001 [Penicillium herquei]